MPKTDAQKRARNKYEAKTYTIIGCKVRKERAEAFRSACLARGTTPAAVFKTAMAAFMADAAPDAPGSDDSGSGGDCII